MVSLCLTVLQRFIQTMRAIQGALIVAASIQIILGYSQVWGLFSRYSFYIRFSSRPEELPVVDMLQELNSFSPQLLQSPRNGACRWTGWFGLVSTRIPCCKCSILPLFVVLLVSYINHILRILICQMMACFCS